MKFTKKDIVDYYNSVEISFKLWWGLKQCMAMHYGFRDKRARTFRRSLIRFNEVLAEQASIGPTDRVLDAGCGVGGSSIWMARSLGCRAVGITITPQQVVRAHQNAIEQGVGNLTEFYEMDYCNTTFPDASFDVVWGLESICYAPSKKDFIQEAWRLLRPGGRLVVADGFAVKDSYADAEMKIMRGWLDGWAVDWLDTGGQWVSNAQQAGFTQTSFRDVTPHVMASSRRLFAFSLPAMALAAIQYRLGFITKLEALHSKTLYYQYLGLRRKLWQYGIFHAVKP